MSSSHPISELVLLVFVSFLVYFTHTHIQIHILNLCTQIVVCCAHFHILSVLFLFFFNTFYMYFLTYIWSFFYISIWRTFSFFFLYSHTVLYCFEVHKSFPQAPVNGQLVNLQSFLLLQMMLECHTHITHTHAV